MHNHYLEQHAQLEKKHVKFDMKVLRGHFSALARQVHEAVAIRRHAKSGINILNSKYEYSRCILPTLSVKMGEREIREEKEKLYLTKVTEIEEEMEVSKVKNKKRDSDKSQACHPRGKRRKVCIEESKEEKVKTAPRERKRKYQDIQEEEEEGKQKNKHQPTENFCGMKNSSDKLVAKYSVLFKKMKQPTANFKKNLKNSKEVPSSNIHSNKSYSDSGVNQEGKLSQAKGITKLTPSPDVPNHKVESTPNPSVLLATQHHPIPPPPIKPRKKGLELPRHFNCKQINDHFKPVRSPTNLDREQAVKRKMPPGKT